MSFVMELQIILPNKIRQIQEDNYPMFSLICRTLKADDMEEEAANRQDSEWNRARMTTGT